MSQFSAGDSAGTLIASRAMNADFTTAAFEVGAQQEIALQVVWAAADKTDATIDIQASVDGTNFESYASAIYTIGTAAGNHVWRVILGSIPYFQVVYKKGTNTTGTFSVVYRKEVPACQ